MAWRDARRQTIAERLKRGAMLTSDVVATDPVILKNSFEAARRNVPWWVRLWRWFTWKGGWIQ